MGKKNGCFETSQIMGRTEFAWGCLKIAFFFSESFPLYFSCKILVHFPCCPEKLEIRKNSTTVERSLEKKEKIIPKNTGKFVVIFSGLLSNLIHSFPPYLVPLIKTNRTSKMFWPKILKNVKRKISKKLSLLDFHIPKHSLN